MSDGGEGGLEINGGELQDFTIDQLAGATALVLGSVGALLMIIWKSRCACRVRLGLSDKCYIFDCSREPPAAGDDSDDENPKTPKQPTEKDKVKKDDKKKDKVKKVDKVDRTSHELEPEPEPEPVIP